MRTTIAFTPCFFSTAAWALAVSTSSLKSTVETPDGLTMVGVPSSVIPMKPTLVPAISLTQVPGSRVPLPSFFTTLAASHGKSAPAYGWSGK